MNFLSHNVFDYKWMLNVWIKETKTSSKLNNNFMLNSKFNDNFWIYLCLNWIELIYSWSWKLVVIDFLLIVGLPLSRCRIAIWLVNMTVGLDFQIVGSALVFRGYSSIMLNVGSPLSRCQIAVFYSDCYSELFCKIIVWP